MMKKITGVLLYISALLVCVSCQKKDCEYFNGEIVLVGNTGKKPLKVSLEKLTLDGLNFGEMAVHDSLMFFLNTKLSDRFFNVFNVDSGEELGTFCNKGGGPEEVFCLGKILQFFEESDGLKTLLFAPNEQKLLVWNITHSIEENNTVIDKVVPYRWRQENGGENYNEIYLLNDSTLLAKVDPFVKKNGKHTLPHYQKRTFYTDQLLQSYSIFKLPIHNEDSSVMPEFFFNSNDALKPDGTKVVQAMVHLPQLNILDLETGKVTGYRLEDGEDFSVFQKNEDLKNHYIRVQADDQYIYAVYFGKKAWAYHEIPYVDMIHVFSWDGKLIQRIKTDLDIDKIALDRVRNRLYVARPKSDDVYYLDLNGIL